jgi:hypothetical protein
MRGDTGKPMGTWSSGLELVLLLTFLVVLHRLGLI